MKKICNMNYEEATENFAKFSGKHCISDDYDMSVDILSTINSHLSSEDAANYIYNIFCYGFMAGYKQNETDSKQNTKFHDETHKALTELAYNLPFGYNADYFYHIMCRKISRPVLEYIKTKSIREKALLTHDQIHDLESELTKGAESNER